MSDSHDAVDKATLAQFEQLYNQRGQPAELDEAFVQEYFNSIKPDETDTQPPVLAPHSTKAEVYNKSLVRVHIESKKRSFYVKYIAATGIPPRSPVGALS